MAWEIVFIDEVTQWFATLDPTTEKLVSAALDLLEEHGPTLGRPLVDTLTGSALSNLKELRPGSTGNTEIRLLFAFDPKRQAIILTAGDKSGEWHTWYAKHIPLAEQRYALWLSGHYSEELL